MNVICNVNNPKLNICKSHKYVVKKFNINTIKIYDDIDDKLIDIIYKIFDYVFCNTIHKEQGGTIKDNYNIFDLDYINDKKLVYTALSRGVSYDKIHFNYTNKIYNTIVRRIIPIEHKISSKMDEDDKYKKGKIYKISYDGKLVYVGSTIKKIEHILQEHIDMCKKLNNRFAMFLRNCDKYILQIELIVNYKCNNRYELEIEEAKYIKSYDGLYNTKDKKKE
jgi:hypothetical protein